MFNLGITEIVLILIVALIFIGPDKLPEVARTLGRLVWQVKNTAEEFRKEIALPDLEKDNDILKKELDELKGSLNKKSNFKLDDKND